MMLWVYAHCYTFLQKIVYIYFYFFILILFVCLFSSFLKIASLMKIPFLDEEVAHNSFPRKVCVKIFRKDSYMNFVLVVVVIWLRQVGSLYFLWRYVTFLINTEAVFCSGWKLFEKRNLFEISKPEFMWKETRK
jgi:hypothetical protein